MLILGLKTDRDRHHTLQENGRRETDGRESSSPVRAQRDKGSISGLFVRIRFLNQDFNRSYDQLNRIPEGNRARLTRIEGLAGVGRARRDGSQV